MTEARLRGTIGIAITLCGVAGCHGSGNSTGRIDAPLVFDTDVRRAYAPARGCRFPGEHSGLNAFSVWVSRDDASAFAELWQSPPAIQELPVGSVVVKEVYTGTDCVPSEVDHWVAMKKEKGFDPAHADWHWQEVEVGGQIKTNGAATACIDCHRGRDDTTCIGYGEQNGRDYTCTAPDSDGGR